VSEVLEVLYEETEETAPASIHELKPKMRLQGTVTRVELFGAFVNIGLDSDGLVHVSQLRAERVNRVSDVINEGDAVTVWVLSTDTKAKRIELTLLEPPAVDWNEIRSGQVYQGTVKRVERYGAFVDIGATRDGLVHVSEITSDYIQDPKEYVKVGEEVQVKVLKVDDRRRRIELSIKAVEDNLALAEDEDDLEEVPTAMEMAWRDAQSDQSAADAQARRKKASQKRKQDDIFSRTLLLRSEQE